MGNRSVTSEVITGMLLDEMSTDTAGLWAVPEVSGGVGSGLFEDWMATAESDVFAALARNGLFGPVVGESVFALFVEEVLLKAFKILSAVVLCRFSR